MALLRQSRPWLLNRILGAQVNTPQRFQLQTSAIDNSAAHKLLLSDSCVKRLQDITKEQNKSYLRVIVEGGGCSGFQYKFELSEDSLVDDDRVFERDGAKVVIDETSLEYLDGSTVDYHTELIRAAFRIMDNPMADTGCSCGSSFSVKL